MDENLELIRKTLKKYSQEHLLNGYERLNEVKQKQLLGQIESTDFEGCRTGTGNKKLKKPLVILSGAAIGCGVEESVFFLEVRILRLRAFSTSLRMTEEICWCGGKKL